MKLSRRQSLKAMAMAAGIEAGQRVALAAPPPIRLIVLDVGGTIIQDRGDVPEALQSAFAKHGIKVTREEISHWRGASKREVIRHFANEGLVGAIYADFNARAIDVYRNVPPIAGAEAAFAELRRAGYLLASSTGFGREIAASIFHRLGWEQYFAAMITSDDVAQGRPAPYMIFHAMEAARIVDVSQVVIVGDTPLDLQAGRNAGVRGIVGVLSGASTEERLRPEPHTDILASVAQLPALIASKYSV